MPLFHPRRIAILLCVAIACVYAEKHAASIATMSVPEIEDKLQVSSCCPPTLLLLPTQNQLLDPRGVYTC